MRLFTIGFTKKTAKEFFEILKQNGVKRLIDTRLNTKSQLAGFTKHNDLQYFLKEICGIEYRYMPELAPTKELLRGYQKKLISWDQYENEYIALLANRNILVNMDLSLFDDACLLCSESLAKQCHRRLAAEYIAKANKGIKVIHL